MYTHYYFVPNRLLFKGWEDFITGGEDGLDQTLLPTIDLNELKHTEGPLDNGSLADYLGLPSSDEIAASDASLHVSALPFAAYNLIFNEYYRDQNLIENKWPVIKDYLDDGGRMSVLSLFAEGF